MSLFLCFFTLCLLSKRDEKQTQKIKYLFFSVYIFKRYTHQKREILLYSFIILYILLYSNKFSLNKVNIYISHIKLTKVIDENYTVDND